MLINFPGIFASDKKYKISSAGANNFSAQIIYLYSYNKV